MKLLILAVVLLLSSCATQKRYAYEGVNSTKGTRATLIKIERTQFGLKHHFVTDDGRTVFETYQTRLELNKCYILKNH